MGRTRSKGSLGERTDKLEKGKKVDKTRKVEKDNVKSKQQQQKQRQLQEPKQELQQSQLSLKIDDARTKDKLTALSFNERLIAKSGGVTPSVRELLIRLGKLAEEMKSLGQDNVQRDSLLKVAQELSHSSLLTHKDRGVRAWTACCIVEMFRLCAPNAPYNAGQLRAIFTMILNTVFPELGNANHPYNEQHVFVLKSLAEVQSIVLLTDIDSARDLMTYLFTTCFDVLSTAATTGSETSGDELSKNIEHYMTALLATLVTEIEGGLPTEITEILLAQFLRADPATIIAGQTKGSKKGGNALGAASINDIKLNQTRLCVKEAPLAYNMAKNICNSCVDAMGRAVSHYFSSLVMEVAGLTRSVANTINESGKASGSGGATSSDRGTQNKELSDELVRAHRLARELWRATPEVLTGVMGQLEAELVTENVQIRLLATETVGDMIGGIGASGGRTMRPLDPEAYPSQSLCDQINETSKWKRDGAAPGNKKVGTMCINEEYNFFTTPTSFHSFILQHNGTYEMFLGRRNDRSALVRAGFAGTITRIILTSAGGVGLEEAEERRLLEYLASMLVDVDERVRLASVRGIEAYDFRSIVEKLGRHGGVDKKGTVLNHLVERVKDRRATVRTAAIVLLSKIWGVASGAIAEAKEGISEMLSSIASRIIETYYINDVEITGLVDRAIYEYIIPIRYPVMSGKKATGEVEKIRTERILVLAKGLEVKAKRVFFSRLNNQGGLARYMEAFLGRSEQYNGGVGTGETNVRSQLKMLIDYFAGTLPDGARAMTELWKFVEMNDRRCYTLIRFCMDVESNYSKVTRSMRELNKRLLWAGASGIWEVLEVLLYRVGILVYNRSHVGWIIEYSRTNEKMLGEAGQEMLKEISQGRPEVFKAHIRELSETVGQEGGVDELKACANFARHFPLDVPISQEFSDSLKRYAFEGQDGRSAKYATRILLVGGKSNEIENAMDKQRTITHELLAKCINDFSMDEEFGVAKLATISQTILYGAWDAVENSLDEIMELAVNKVLMRDEMNEQSSEVRTGDTADSEEENGDGYDDSNDDDDDDGWKEKIGRTCVAKALAMKILVNWVCRCQVEGKRVDEIGNRVMKVLIKLLRENGGMGLDEGTVTMSKCEKKLEKAYMRMKSGLMLIKMSSRGKDGGGVDRLLTEDNFNGLALMSQDEVRWVRRGFVEKLMKYLSSERLSGRFLTILFLMAFEPVELVREKVGKWIKAKMVVMIKRGGNIVEGSGRMEETFSRFLGLLAHHPDFENEREVLMDFSQYILFFMRTVSTEENVSLIFYIAQRMKTVELVTSDNQDKPGYRSKSRPTKHTASTISDNLTTQVDVQTNEKKQITETGSGAGPFQSSVGLKQGQEVSRPTCAFPIPSQERTTVSNSPLSRDLPLTFRDSCVDDVNVNLYILSELSQLIIRRWVSMMNWNLQSWPGKLRLSSRVFQSISSTERCREVIMKKHLNNEMNDDSAIDRLIRKFLHETDHHQVHHHHHTTGSHYLHHQADVGVQADTVSRKRRLNPTSPLSTKVAGHKKPRSSRTTKISTNHSKSANASTPATPLRKSSRLSHNQKCYTELSDSNAESLSSTIQSDSESESEGESESETDAIAATETVSVVAVSP